MMEQITEAKVEVNARELNFVDLDFPECAESFKKHVEETITDSTTLIKLDIRWCVVIYSQSHIYLDACISKFTKNKNTKNKLIILTTDNFITRELTCYELFRTTMAVQEKDNSPETVTAALNEYCENNNLCIEIQVFSGDSDDINTPRLCTYIFPDVRVS